VRIERSTLAQWVGAASDAPISETDRQMTGQKNAQKLFNLPA
jgi:hypothetical protein